MEFQDPAKPVLPRLSWISFWIINPEIRSQHRLPTSIVVMARLEEVELIPRKSWAASLDRSLLLTGKISKSINMYCLNTNAKLRKPNLMDSMSLG